MGADDPRCFTFVRQRQVFRSTVYSCMGDTSRSMALGQFKTDLLEGREL